MEVTHVWLDCPVFHPTGTVEALFHLSINLSGQDLSSEQYTDTNLVLVLEKDWRSGIPPVDGAEGRFLMSTTDSIPMKLFVDKKKSQRMNLPL